MTTPYRHQEWVKFRADVIKLYDGRCLKCQRSPYADGIVLQVHHKEYFPGRKPWEYERSECVALCKGCHAAEHGIIMPHTDWVLIGSDDLEDLIGTCDYCRTALRYVYAIEHPKWGSMGVGTDCCDSLTMTTEASEHHDAYVKRVEMRDRFIESPRWRGDHSGMLSIQRKGIVGFIAPMGQKFRIGIALTVGKIDYDSLFDAKIGLFDLIESGKAAEFLARRRQKQLMGKPHAGQTV